MASDAQCNFRVWTSRPEPFIHSPLQISPPHNLFSAQRFNETTRLNFRAHLDTRIREVETAGRLFVSIIEIEKYSPAVAATLGSCIPGFSKDILENVIYNTSSGQNLSVIPNTQTTPRGIQFLLNYPFVLPHGEESQADKDTTIGFLPIGAWICPSAGAVQNDDKRKRIFLVCANSTVPERLASHYGSAVRRRWDRLQECPLWIFADLLQVFGDWGQVCNASKRNVAMYHNQIHSHPHANPLLDVTRGLHNDAAKMLSLREQLRVHSSALARFLRLDEVTAEQDLVERVQEHFEGISYHEETSQVILRQLENMMSLAFNIETMTQGQRVARLNALAFAFIPISWVASIFGMTQFSISAVWYPLWAFVVLIAVVLVLFAPPILRSAYHYILATLTSQGPKQKKPSASTREVRRNSTPDEYEYYYAMRSMRLGGAFQPQVMITKDFNEGPTREIRPLRSPDSIWSSPTQPVPHNAAAHGEDRRKVRSVTYTPMFASLQQPNRVDSDLASDFSAGAAGHEKTFVEGWTRSPSIMEEDDKMKFDLEA